MTSGLTIAERGTGPAVVLVHGALGDYRQWSTIADRLDPPYRVLAISRRHHWPAEKPGRDVPYSYESHSDDLVEWLGSRAAPVHLVGHSYGAGVALVTALSRPERVRSLVLIEPAFGSVVPASATGFAAELESRNAMMAAVQSLVREGQDDAAARTLIDWVQGAEDGFARLPGPVKDGLLANAATMGPTFRVAARNVTGDQLRGLRAPTLVLHGERTRAWYRLIAESAAACIPGAAAGVIPGAAHMAIVEHPHEVAALLLPFLARH